MVSQVVPMSQRKINRPMRRMSRGLIGASLSEPHIDELNARDLYYYYYYSYIYLYGMSVTCEPL